MVSNRSLDRTQVNIHGSPCIPCSISCCFLVIEDNKIYTKKYKKCAILTLKYQEFSEKGVLPHPPSSFHRLGSRLWNSTLPSLQLQVLDPPTVRLCIYVLIDSDFKLCGPVYMCFILFIFCFYVFFLFTHLCVFTVYNLLPVRFLY